MSIQETTLLAVTTGAANSESLHCNGLRNELHFTCPGIADGDGNAEVEMYDTLTDAWYPYYLDGVLQTIRMTTNNENTGVVVRAAGLYRIAKPATAGAAGVVCTSNF